MSGYARLSLKLGTSAGKVRNINYWISVFRIPILSLYKYQGFLMID